MLISEDMRSKFTRAERKAESDFHLLRHVENQVLILVKHVALVFQAQGFAIELEDDLQKGDIALHPPHTKAIVVCCGLPD